MVTVDPIWYIKEAMTDKERADLDELEADLAAESGLISDPDVKEEEEEAPGSDLDDTYPRVEEEGQAEEITEDEAEENVSEEEATSLGVTEKKTEKKKPKVQQKPSINHKGKKMAPKKIETEEKNTQGMQVDREVMKDLRRLQAQIMLDTGERVTTSDAVKFAVDKALDK